MDIHLSVLCPNILLYSLYKQFTSQSYLPSKRIMFKHYPPLSHMHPHIGVAQSSFPHIDPDPSFLVYAHRLAYGAGSGDQFL